MENYNIDNEEMKQVFKQRRTILRQRTENEKAEIDRRASLEKAEIDRKTRVEKQAADNKEAEEMAKIARDEDKWIALCQQRRDLRRKEILADLERIAALNEKNGMTEEGGKQ